jgi:hypothetical protein
MANRRNISNRDMLRRMGHKRAGMTRAEWLQKAGLAAAGMGAAAVGLGGVAKAQVVDLSNGVCEVYPTGTTTDLGNLQAAIDNPNCSTIHLMTYKYGDASKAFTPFVHTLGEALFIYNKSITITGISERGQKPQINGGGAGGSNQQGAISILGGFGTGSGPTVNIRNVVLNKPSWVGILTNGFAHVTIEDVDILDHNNIQSGDESTWGILFHSNGTATVRGCYITGDPENFEYATMESGICYAGFPEIPDAIPPDLGGADVIIENNTIIGTYANPDFGSAYPYGDRNLPTKTGIMAIDFVTYWPNPYVNSFAKIKNNWIAAETGVLCHSKNGKNGIFTEITDNHIVPSNMIDPTITNITGSKLVGISTSLYPVPPPPFSPEIDSLHNATIARNTIYMDGNLLAEFGFNGYGMTISGTNNQVHSNKIIGNCDYGFYVFEGSTNNRFHGNNLTGFDTYQNALYYFESGACNNIVQGYTDRGQNKLVVDEDECNSVTGVK